MELNSSNANSTTGPHGITPSRYGVALTRFLFKALLQEPVAGNFVPVDAITSMNDLAQKLQLT